MKCGARTGKLTHHVCQETRTTKRPTQFILPKAPPTATSKRNDRAQSTVQRGPPPPSDRKKVILLNKSYQKRTVPEEAGCHSTGRSDVRMAPMPLCRPQCSRPILHQTLKEGKILRFGILSEFLPLT